MLKSIELERQLGLERILKSLEPEVFHCSYCQDTKIHQQYEMAWKRSFKSKVEFRQIYQIRVCSSCILTSFIENTWCEELDDFDWQAKVGEKVDNNYNRIPDTQRLSCSSYNLVQAMLLKELQEIFSTSELLFVEEIVMSMNSNFYDVAAIGVRSIVEKFFYLVGTSASRDRFVKQQAKKFDGTTKTRNNYQYKLLWIFENELISNEQRSSLQSIIHLGNFAAHKMDMSKSTTTHVSKNDLLTSSFKTLLSLTIQYKQSSFNTSLESNV